MQDKVEKLITLINKFIDSYNNFDIKNLDEILSDDFEFKNISHGEVVESTSSLVEFSLVIEQAKALFSKRKVQIQNMNVNGNIIDVDIICNATMAISTIDGLEVDQEISFKGSFTFSIKEDKIIKLVYIS